MCDCKIVANAEFIETGIIEYLNIKYCPLHAAAEQLLEALRNAQEWIIDETGWRTDADDLKEEIRAAIAAAEPKQPK